LIKDSVNLNENNKTTVKLLVDIQLNSNKDIINKNLNRNYQNSTLINSTSNFLQTFKKSLTVLVFNEYKTSEPIEIKIISKLYFLLS
jgi:hypothetical protein